MLYAQNKFTMSQEGQKATLSCEASTLQYYGAHVIAVYSEKVNAGVVFRLQDVERERDGTILCWNFISSSYPNVTLVIFND